MGVGGREKRLGVVEREREKILGVVEREREEIGGG